MAASGNDHLRGYITYLTPPHIPFAAFITSVRFLSFLVENSNLFLKGELLLEIQLRPEQELMWKKVSFGI